VPDRDPNIADKENLKLAKSAKNKTTLDFGSPYMNMMSPQGEEIVGSLINKNSIIYHAGSEVVEKEEYDSQFRVFLRL
jgi:predicted subunit of tRNA(5-methylaminomethyl-2-thiouridylate) methyltransferase